MDHPTKSSIEAMPVAQQIELLGRHPEYLALRCEVAEMADDRKELLEVALDRRCNNNEHP